MPGASTEVVKQQVVADSAKFIGNSEAYSADLIVIAGCLNGIPAPTQPCQAVLELSTDDVAWTRATSKPFAGGDGITSLASFALSEWAQTGAWRHYRLTFGSHVGGAVTVAASTGQAPIFKEEHEPKRGAGHEPHPLKR